MSASSSSSSRSERSPQPRRRLPPTESHDTEVGERTADLRRRAKEAARRRQTMLGAVSVGLFLVFAIGGIWYWFAETNAAEAAKKELADAQQALHNEVDKLNLDDAAQAERVVHRLEATQAQWQTWPSASQFADLRNKAVAALAVARITATVQDGIKQLDQQAAAPGADLAAWSGMHQRAHALTDAMKGTSDAVKQQVRACIDRVDDGYLTALRTATGGDAGGDPKTVLANLQTAESLTLDRLTAAEQARDRAGHDRWTATLKDFVKAEDGVVAKICGPAAIAAAAWRDLVPGTKTADWLQSATGGLEHAVAGDSLTIEAKDAGEKRGGVIVLGGHQFRHCEVEFDATLDAGSATILVRADKRAQATNAAAVKLTLDEAADAVHLQAGAPVHVDMLVLGSDLVVQAKEKKLESKLPVQARSGSFAVIVTTGTSLHLTHLRVKELT